jgi:serine protease Do
MNIAGLGEIAEQVRRYTVLVEPGERGNGSGVIWSSDGIIITNAHVARSTRPRVTLWDGREFTAEVMSREARLDLAALHIPADGLASATPVDSSQVRPGEVAIAVGNPMGFLGAMTLGVIHNVGPVRATGARRWIQADIRLAPGNSGGPLADTRGRVIGINTMSLGGRLALAIPSDEVRRFLRSGSGVQWLGVSVTPVRLPKSSESRNGLLLAEIEPGGPAAQSSLLPGDILLGTENVTFSSAEDLATVLEGNEPRVLRLRFLRGDYGNVRRVSVSLGQERSPIAA